MHTDRSVLKIANTIWSRLCCVQQILVWSVSLKGHGEHLSPLVIFMLYTGARVGEALWLDWRNVDLTRAHVQFLKTKNQQPRGVPLHRRVVAALASLPQREGHVFLRPDGRPYASLHNDDDSDTSAGSRIKTAFRGACRRAGIESFHPHDCRHTWATCGGRRHADLQRVSPYATDALDLKVAIVGGSAQPKRQLLEIGCSVPLLLPLLMILLS